MGNSAILRRSEENAKGALFHVRLVVGRQPLIAEGKRFVKLEAARGRPVFRVFYLSLGAVTACLFGENRR